MKALVLIRPQGAKVHCREELGARARGHGPRLYHASEGRGDVHVLVQRSFDDHYQHRVVETGPPAVDGQRLTTAARREIGQVVKRYELRARRRVIRTNCAARRSCTEHEAHQGHPGDGSSGATHARFLLPRLLMIV